MEQELFEALGILIENSDKDGMVDNPDSLGIYFGIRSMLGKLKYIQNYSRSCSILTKGRIAYNQQLLEINQYEQNKQEKRDEILDDRTFQMDMQRQGFKLDILSAIIGTLFGLGIGLLTHFIF